MLLQRYVAKLPHGTFWAFTVDGQKLLREKVRDGWKEFYEVDILDSQLPAELQEKLKNPGYYFTKPTDAQIREANKFVSWREKGATLQTHTAQFDGKSYLVLAETKLTSPSVIHEGEQDYHPVSRKIAAAIEGTGWFVGSEALEDASQRFSAGILKKLQEKGIQMGIQVTNAEVSVRPKVKNSIIDIARRIIKG